MSATVAIEPTSSSANKTWNSKAIFSSEYLEIELALSKFETNFEASNHAKTARVCATLVEMGHECVLEVVVNSTNKQLYRDNEIIIREICPEKIAQMGAPLDMSIHENKDIAVNALINKDPRYTIEDTDMVPSNKRLKDFIELHGVGYRLDHIAWGVSEG